MEQTLGSSAATLSRRSPKRAAWTWTAAVWSRRLGSLIAIMLLASYVAWGNWAFWEANHGNVLVVLTLVSCFAAVTLTARMSLFPRSQDERLGALLLGITAAFLFVAAVITLGRLQYSRTFLGAAYTLCLFWGILELLWMRGRPPLRLALAPGGIAGAVGELQGPDWHWLDRPDVEEVVGTPIDAVVVDLHEPLPPQWVRFLAECSLGRVPTYHAAAVYEALTGQVSIAHLSHGLLGGFAPGWGGMAVKRAVDVLMMLLFLPLLIPLLLLTALAVWVETPTAPIFFWQERAGRGGRPFRMVKFRSMRPEAEAAGAQFARNGDERTTQVGRFIRRYRLDELPQFWNVLRGEMSLIGPRPEQVAFAQQFAAEMPFYSYRHLVKPGITGWAQVNQGYAAGLDETRIKLQYDLYYISHLSLWLDVLVLIKTFRVLVTGFGAR